MSSGHYALKGLSAMRRNAKRPCTGGYSTVNCTAESPSEKRKSPDAKPPSAARTAASMCAPSGRMRAARALPTVDNVLAPKNWRQGGVSKWRAPDFDDVTARDHGSDVALFGVRRGNYERTPRVPSSEVPALLKDKQNANEARSKSTV